MEGNQGGGKTGETPDSPTAINTELGWVLSGPVGNMPKNKTVQCELNSNTCFKSAKPN